MAYQPYNYPAYNNAYSPVQPFQTPRMDIPQYQQQTPVQPQQIAQQAMQGISPASRPVANREEANAVSADFSGATMLFPDMTHNRVYLKRWNFGTGAADFMEFAPVVQTQQEAARQEIAPAFATVQDVSALKETVEQLQAEIERLKKPAGKAAKKNDPDE